MISPISESAGAELSDQEIQELPQPLQWAFRTLREHPHILALSVFRISSDDARVLALFTLLTNLPGRWQSESPSGVRREEVITMSFGLDYPQSSPRPYLRDDFNRAHPHLQPRPPTCLPEPCLVDGSPREFVQATGGINGLTDQLVLWLERASEVNLIDPAQGWEPVRRDTIDSVIIVNSEQLRNGVTNRGGCSCYQGTVQWPTAVDDPFYFSYADLSQRRDLTRSTLKSLRLSSPDEPIRIFDSLFLFAWPGSKIDGSLKIDGRYSPETVNSVQTLFERAKVFGCHIDLKIQVRKLRKLLHGVELHDPIPITFILAARRPCHLIGTSSEIELCPYLLLVKSGRDLLENSDTKVSPMGHRDPVSLDILSKTSGKDPNVIRRNWALIGCGSVGSKLAMHLAREGAGPHAVVDKDYLEPHNYARHIELPIEGAWAQGLMRRKSTALAASLKRLCQQPLDCFIDVIQLIADHEHDFLSNSSNNVMVNTTGSLVVREVLANSTWHSENGRPLMVECCLMGAGQVGYLSKEGASGNPNASDVLTAFYRELIDRPSLGTTIFEAGTDLINIGQGCGSQSVIMSDAQISQHVAPFAITLSNMLDDSVNESSGQLIFQVIDSEGAGMKSFTKPIYPVIEVFGENEHSPVARLSQSVVTTIEQQIAENPGVETGGVLIGRYSSIGHTFNVVDTIPPPCDSTSQPDLFVLGKQGLQTQIDAYTRKSGGTLYALGTWHNHLSNTGPSALDRKSAKRLANAQQFPLLMLIHTPGKMLTVSPLA